MKSVLSPRRLLTGVVVILLALVLPQLALAYSFWAAFPRDTVGLSRPVIGQRLSLDPDEPDPKARMWLDGQRVEVTWDRATGCLRYVPPTPLPPGKHQVKLVVEMDGYQPVVSEYDFTVAADAVATLPGPDAEDRLALDYLNVLRVSAGLPAMAYDLSLGQAASRHALYLMANPGSPAHREALGAPGFCGEGPGDRGEFWGYLDGVAEVVAFEGPAEAAIEAWVETIYHRLSLVHPANTEMGYGYAGGRHAPEGAFNVINSGPGGDEPGAIPWPYPGQTGVRTSWRGLESPDPLRLYPGTTGPVGYTITLTFASQPSSLTLTSWALTGSDGSQPAVMTFSPVNDDQLKNTVALIPYQPLAPLTTYSVRLAGAVDYGHGPGPYERSWSFTTGASELEMGPGWRYWFWQTGDSMRVQTEGLRVRKGVRVFVGGLEVQDLVVASRNEFSFRLPSGLDGGRDDALFVDSDGDEIAFDLPDGVDLVSGDSAFVTARVRILGAGQEVSGLAWGSGGPVLVPELALSTLGGIPFRIAGLDRTHWTLGGRPGCVTGGSPVACVGGRRLIMRLAPRTIDGLAYVPLEFVEALVRSASAFSDTAVHWAKDDVERLAGMGIVSGVGDGSFRPDAKLTRAAFVKMLVKARSLELVPGDAGAFADTASHWVASQGFLGPALAAGIVRAEDYPDGFFQPDRDITREEIAVMVVRAMGREDEAATRQLTLEGGTAVIGGVRFRDAGLWTRAGFVVVAMEREIVRGYLEADGTKTFRPADLATRAEAATMVCRMLTQLGQ
jgi:uncharacterized protein YkwD